MTDRILLIEDDPRLADLVKDYLATAGFSVSLAPTGRQGLRHHERETFDALILDLMLPDMDGLEVCRKIRARAQTPILMLTARGDDLDIVGGLEAGADDYVVKPVEPRVLDARIRAVLRRMARAGSPAETYGELVIDRGSLVVQRAGREVSLTPTELRVVELASEGLTNAAIAERMFISAATVKVHLAHVYGKLDVPNRAALATVAAKHASLA